MSLNTIDSAMTTNLLKTDNFLSEFTADPGEQEMAAVNVGINYAIPIGTIIVWPRNFLPFGYLSCNGGAISRTGYADLFAILGTTFGAGNGTTTFNLPNITAGFTVSNGTVYYLIKHAYVSGI
jgi:hypothetical protein